MICSRPPPRRRTVARHGSRSSRKASPSAAATGAARTVKTAGSKSARRKTDAGDRRPRKSPALKSPVRLRPGSRSRVGSESAASAVSRQAEGCGPRRRADEAAPPKSIPPGRARASDRRRRALSKREDSKRSALRMPLLSVAGRRRAACRRRPSISVSVWSDLHGLTGISPNTRLRIVSDVANYKISNPNPDEATASGACRA